MNINLKTGGPVRLCRSLHQLSWVSNMIKRFDTGRIDMYTQRL